jgi:hypothetical protein
MRNTGQNPHKMNKPALRTRYKIDDRQGLAALIRAEIDQRFDGNLLSAARASRMLQPELYRLSVGKLRAIGFRTLMGLHRLLIPRRSALERCIVSPQAQELYAAYLEWVSNELDRVVNRSSLGNTAVGRALMSVTGWEIERLAEFEAAVQRVRQKCRVECEAFDQFLERRKHSDRRVQLAYYRIVAPLLDARESGFVERRIDDLSDKELRAFLKAGIQREKILLTRAPAIQSAKHAAEHDPLDLMSLYGFALDPRAYMGRNVDPLLRQYVRRLAARK